MGQLHKASRTVDAVAGYLKALGDSTSDATAIDLDVGVTSQPADQDSVFRVQESADGTSFVLEFTLDADDTGMQLRQCFCVHALCKHPRRHARPHEGLPSAALPA